MSENSMIQWTDHTFNPWWGCTKVSPACKFCYAESFANIYRGKENLWGPNGNRVRTKSVWREPIKWNKAVAEGTSDKDKVFCASMADVFEEHPQILDEWRYDLFSLIEKTKHLQWLLLTKRPENVNKLVPWHWILANAWPTNLWIGTTVENQTEYDKRVPHLMKLPAPIRFVSMEPLLGHITITDELDWIIVGGESGKNARKMEEEHLWSIQEQAAQKRIPLFFKQTGSVLAKQWNLKDKKGGNPNEWPIELIDNWNSPIQEFPVEYARRKIKL